MANIEVKLPVEEATKSIEIASFTADTLGATNTIVNAFDNKNNSMHIIIDAGAAGNVTFKAGNNYPNAMLGDLTVAVKAGLNDIIIEDISRFENRDKSLVITTSVTGKIYAVAKRAGVKPVEA